MYASHTNLPSNKNSKPLVQDQTYDLGNNNLQKLFSYTLSVVNASAYFSTSDTKDFLESRRNFTR